MIISDEEIEDVINVVKYIEYFALLIKSVTQTIGNKTIKRRDGTFGTLSGSLGTSLFRNMLTSKDAISYLSRWWVKSNKTNASNSKSRVLFLMQPHPLTNFDIQINFQNEPAVKQVQWRLNCAYSRNIWPKIKDRAYVTNLDEFKQIGTHWIALKSNTFQNKLICYLAIRIS